MVYAVAGRHIDNFHIGMVMEYRITVSVMKYDPGVKIAFHIHVGDTAVVDGLILIHIGVGRYNKAAFLNSLFIL